MKFDEFLDNCIACGGNLTAMLMSGIKAVALEVHEAMPDRKYEFDEVCFIVNHLCSDRPHYRCNISINGQFIEFGHDGTFHYREATAEERSLSIKDFYVKYNGMSEEEFDAVMNS